MPMYRALSGRSIILKVTSLQFCVNTTKQLNISHVTCDCTQFQADQFSELFSSSRKYSQQNATYLILKIFQFSDERKRRKFHKVSVVSKLNYQCLLETEQNIPKSSFGKNSITQIEAFLLLIWEDPLSNPFPDIGNIETVFLSLSTYVPLQYSK